MGKEKENQRKLFGKNVGIFATCLIDIIRPSVGFASAKLIELSGCNVSVPRLQSCCGQPAYNSGDYDSSISIAREVVKVFIDFDAYYIEHILSFYASISSFRAVDFFTPPLTQNWQ